MKGKSKVAFYISVYLPLIIIFFIGCLCGVFIGFSGGVQWGTKDCGVLSTITILVSLTAAWAYSQLR